MIGALLPLIAPIFEKIVDAIFPGDSEAATLAKIELQKRGIEIEGALQQAVMQQATEQTKVNAEEAKHSNIFVAGWRPFIGWVCGAAFAYNFVLYPILSTVAALEGVDVSLLPTLDTGALITVLMGMLGLGGMRTFEKYQGVVDSTFKRR